MPPIARLLLTLCLAAPGTSAAQMMIASSSSHSLAVKTDGTVVAWGSDREGALGTGRVLDSRLPVKVPGLPRVANLVSRSNLVLAIDGNGRVWSWGEGSAPLGPREGADPGIPSRIRGLANVVGVAAGTLSATAVRRDGTVVCWGRCQANVTPIPGAPGLATVDGLTDIVAIAQGQTQLLALRRDGTVLASGDNFYGDVGDGTRGVARRTPYLVPGLSNIVRLDAALGRSVALRSDGTVFFWGSNTLGAPASLNAPQALAGLGGAATSIFAGRPTLAVRADGTVWSFQDAAAAPVAGFTAARTAANASLLTDSVLVLGADGLVRGKGPNSYGQLGNGTTAFATDPVQVLGLAGVVRLDGNERAFTALTATGEVWTWGGNGNLLGNGDPQDRSQPFAVPGLANIVAVATGQDSSYALSATGQVYSWGSNVGGKLGRPGITRSSVPTLVPGLTGVARIAAGQNHVLYLKATGALFHSGRTRSNPDDTCTGACATIDALLGQPITGLPANFQSIAAGADTSYFIAGGNLWAWGFNGQGQLGLGTTTDTAYPTLVNTGGRLVRRVATQRATVLAIVDDAGTDRVMAWGDNGTNQTGRSFVAPGYFTTPGFVASPSTNGAVDIATGFFHSLVLRFDGQVLAFGNNARGELGDGTTTNSVLAKPVQGLGPQGNIFADIASLSAGETRSFALRGDGLVYGWGAPNGSGYGNLADGTFVRRSSPVAAISEKATANLDDTACTNSLADTFWYLDLDPSVCVAVPAAKVPSVLPIAVQSTSSGATTLSAELGVRRVHQGQVKKTFVLGAVPPTFLDAVPLAPGTAAQSFDAKSRAKAGGTLIVQLTPAGWSVVSGPISAFFDGVSAAVRQQLKLLEAVPPDKMPGAQFCVGYGDSAEEMLASAQLRVVATVPGTDLTVQLPCLLSGTYIDGPASSLLGSPVSLRSIVVGENPTGTVQFKDGAANVGGANTLVATSPSFGSALVSTSALAAGDHALTAAYSGDANPINAASVSGPLAHRVVAAKASSATTIGGESRSLQGTSTTFEAAVAGANPSGVVTFRDGAAALASAALSAGLARVTVSGLAVGVHSITAEYAGDAANFASSSTPLAHTIYTAASQAAVTLAPPGNAATANQAAAFTITVTGAAPTGTVELVEGFAVIGSAPLAGGNATVNASFPTPGLRLVYARYAGDANNTGADSASVAVDVLPSAGLAPSVTLLAASANPTTLGQAVTFTATVSGGAGTATGLVAFNDGGIAIPGCASVSLVSGTATCPTNALGAGSRAIVAAYGGSGTYGPSTSATLVQVVDAGPSLLAPSIGALDFGGQSMNTTAPPRAVTFTNTSGAALTLSSVGVPANFTLAGHDCASLAAGASCTVNVSFAPAVEGAVQGLLTLTYAGGGPTAVTLTGTGERSLVTHYYRAILRRAPDAPGKAFWEAEAVRLPQIGANVNETWFAMAQSFYASPEYLAFNRDTTGFVTDLYNTFFNRAPDGPGLAFWSGQVAQGMPREVVLAGFMFSPEFTAFAQAIFGNTQVRRELDTVVDFYRGLLGRLPDSGGFAYWVGQFRIAQCQGAAAVTTQAETISSGFATSGEYAQRVRSNAQYVGDLYNAFLRRGGDLDGVQFWITELGNATLTREQVRQSFVASAEFQGRVQQVIAQGCLP